MVWMEIKNSAPAIIKSGGNPIEVLLWARGKSLWQVRNFLGKTDKTKFEEIHVERRNSSVHDNLDIMKRRRSSIKIDFTGKGGNCKPDEMSKKIIKHDGDKIRKIRQLVNFDENSLALSATQKNMYGIIDEE